MIKNTNDSLAREPYLSIDLNMGTLNRLPTFSSGPKLEGDNLEEVYQQIKAAGFMGLQDADPELCRTFGMNSHGGARVNQALEADEIARINKEAGHQCVTLHVGWGMEDDLQIDNIVDAIINASIKHDIPLYIETHRATITQDIWRTVQLTQRFPEIRFNGDFSHWYTGLEMVYGDIQSKFDFLNPVFDRVRFLHARIGNPGCIQVDIGDGADQTYVEHFKEMWTRSMLGFLKTAKPGDYLSFNPELLEPSIYYARQFPNASGELVEEGDRWQQALLYADIANDCWEKAKILAHRG